MTLSLEHLGAIVGLLMGLLHKFNIVFQGIRKPKERERGDQPVGGAVRTHTALIDLLHSFIWASSWHPQTVTVVTSKVTDHITITN